MTEEQFEIVRKVILDNPSIAIDFMGDKTTLVEMFLQYEKALPTELSPSSLMFMGWLIGDTMQKSIDESINNNPILMEELLKFIKPQGEA